MRILAIGAHYDDVELGCGGTLLKHRDQGDEIHILVVTHSGYSNDSGHERTRAEALAEGLESARRLGATMHSMDLEPLCLMPSERLVIDIFRHVQRIDPDRVYIHRPQDYHADHAATGFASLRACRKCRDIFLFRSNWYLIDQPDADNYYVDISPHMEEKKQLVRIFDSELRKVNYSWLDFVEKQNAAAGQKIDVEYAETFQMARMVR